MKLNKNSCLSYIFCIILPLLFSAFQNNQVIKGKVISVQDGDSITLLLENQVQLKIRLEGIHCPERNQDFGTKAKQFAGDLAFSKNVIVHQSGIDRYGRTLGYVILPDNTNLNEELLKQV